DRQPVTRSDQAGPEDLEVVGHGQAGHDPRRPGRERELDSLGRVDAAGELERRRHAGGDRAERVRVHGRSAPRALEVDDVDQRGAELDEVLGDALGTVRRRADPGRHPGPEHDPGAALLDIDRRDDLHRAQPVPWSARRWKLTGREPPRSRASWKARSEKSAPNRRRSSSRSWSSSTLPRRYDRLYAGVEV